MVNHSKPFMFLLLSGTNVLHSIGVNNLLNRECKTINEIIKYIEFINFMFNISIKLNSEEDWFTLDISQ